MEELEARALECDKQRLKEVRSMLKVHQNESTQNKNNQDEETSRLEELSRKIFNKQTELDISKFSIFIIDNLAKTPYLWLFFMQYFEQTIPICFLYLIPSLACKLIL